MDTMMEDKTSVSVTMAIMTTMVTPPPTTPDIPSAIGPPQFPPKKTVPVKPPPTESPTRTTPSNPDPTDPPKTTQPSCQEMAASGFSKRLYEDGALGTDPTKNPLICELATERYDPSTIFDTPGGAKNQHGQCAEPHAYKRYFFDLEGSEQAISTVAVQARGSFEAFEITTVKRCDTCQLYSRLGDIPTDMAPSIDLYGLPMFPE
ncbi:hypothetical protein EDD86DRAFT_249413 [Gorgonomyces haynaldii]|nr:hypothetical protein EDD86DRAFT_249413 [Gorgonomyces haynaldii]